MQQPEFFWIFPTFGLLDERNSILLWQNEQLPLILCSSLYPHPFHGLVMGNVYLHLDCRLNHVTSLGVETTGAGSETRPYGACLLLCVFYFTRTTTLVSLAPTPTRGGSRPSPSNHRPQRVASAATPVNNPISFSLGQSKHSQQL